MTGRHAVLVLLVAVSACARYSMVEPRQQEIEDLYSVEAQIPWNRMSDGAVELWTVNGPALDAVRFFKDIDDGDPLLKFPSEVKAPVFRATMRANEIMELVVNTWGIAGFHGVDATNLRPAAFGSLSGFRFDLSFYAEDGLRQEGFAVGVVADEALHLIMYTGARIHYFPQYSDAVERMLASIRIRRS